MENIILNIRSEAIANRIMHYCVKNKVQDITNLKLQKLIYYVFGYFYVKNKVFLFDPKSIMFWKHGPVIPDVYHSLKHFKYCIIEDFIEDLLNNDEDGKFNIIDLKQDENTDKIIECITIVIQKIGHKTAQQLRELSHSENGVWDKITKDENNSRNFDAKFLLDKYLPDLRQEIKTILL